MGSRVRCFVIAASDRVRLRLRRFRFAPACTGPSGYCDASAPFGEAKAKLTPDGFLEPLTALAPPADDPRWPRACAGCGTEFAAGDQWQIFQDLVYVRQDDGSELTLDDAPPGAMCDATWAPWKGHDGKSLMVKLPPGKAWDWWHVDHADGKGWSRSGEWPDVTASPSILTNSYHGFLRGGWLED